MLVVQKYGGTSVANLDRIKYVASRCVRTASEGHSLVVVVSAMAGETNRLIDLAHQITQRPSMRELDVLMSTGEQVTSSLLSMTLNAMGYRAISLLGFQANIVTDRRHGDARILKVDTERIRKLLDEGYIVVVAGFQGIDEGGDVTTLGRGGSDTTAVAIAAALDADVCEIYTDVEGVYTADPNIVRDARKLDKISYEEMLELASLGAKVLHNRSVELAKKYSVRLWVKSTFTNDSGTLVTEEDEEMEKIVVSGITYERGVALITLKGMKDMPGMAYRLFDPLAKADIVVDMIVLNITPQGGLDLSFSVGIRDLERSEEIIKSLRDSLGYRELSTYGNMSKVSVVGVGMKTHAGVAAKMFEILAEEGINIYLVNTSEIKISCAIEEKYTELAVRALHDGFIDHMRKTNLK